MDQEKCSLKTTKSTSFLYWIVYIEGFIEVQHMSHGTYSATLILLSINNICEIIIIIHVVNITTKVYTIVYCIPNLSNLVVRNKKGGG